MMVSDEQDPGPPHDDMTQRGRDFMRVRDTVKRTGETRIIWIAANRIGLPAIQNCRNQQYNHPPRKS